MSAMSELSQEDDRLFTVLMLLGSKALICRRVFFGTHAGDS